MAKLLLFNEEAQTKLIKGVDALADAVASTLGPKAGNVAIVKKWGPPTITHDGVTVAKEIDLKDPFENAGAQLVRQAASKTNDIAGDGTTTASIVARAIIKEGFKAIRNGANPQILKNGIEQGTSKVLAELARMAKPLSGKAEIEQIATISSANPELGKLVAEAVEKAGKDGVVSLNEFPSLNITIEHVKGLEFSNGWLSPYFVTDDKNRCGLQDPYILITDQKISSQQDILPFIQLVKRAGSKSFMIIADDVDGEALALLVVNKLQGNFNCLAVKAPALGIRRKQLLEDIAIITGGLVISEDMGRSLQNLSLEDLGHCDRVLSTKESTQIINGLGNKTMIEARIKQVKNEIDDAQNEYDKDQLKQRLAKLTNGVVVINVGGATESEMLEKKFRIEDAVNATRAAIDEGIVAGGETALLKASRVLDKFILPDDDERIGIKVLREALRQPFYQLMHNSGITDGELIAIAMRSPANMGINVLTEKHVDLLKEGVIDPVKVTKSALQYASSSACMVLTTKVIIVEDTKENKNER